MAVSPVYADRNVQADQPRPSVDRESKSHQFDSNLEVETVSFKG